MIQNDNSINSHIGTYLDYYCGLSHSPGFAVLLKGQWGAGKTWFINKYREKLQGNKQKCLYVSLYGMTSFSDIEYAFFQQLHPVLSSKGMAITGKIFRGLLKGALKIDLNDDSKDDGTWSIQIPEINLPEYLKNADKSILIFDDLERCKMEISNILGYINSFVEHQNIKVVIVANEDELFKRDVSNLSNNYKAIKEKLIGKIFSILPDFQGALKDFIDKTNNPNLKEFLSVNTELIQDLFGEAEYENLRNLGLIFLDFERIFDVLPEKAKSKPELLQDILKLLIAFSIEIKRGTMLPKDISKLQEEYVSILSKQVSSRQASSSVTKDNSEEQNSLQEVVGRYTMLNLHDLFPSQKWWEIFFDKGIIDTQELERSLSNSKYFQNENTPDWVRLWHFSDLSDDSFANLLKKIESEYSERQILEIGVIKHVFGLFLMFSDAGLYCKSKEEILEDAKLYINHLRDNNQLALPSPSTIEDTFGSYGSLGFQGKELREFKEFSSYIDEVQELARVESMPSASQDLLITMQSDVWKFYRMICLSSSQTWEVSLQEYHEVPILKYIEPTAFIEKLLLMKSENQKCVFWALCKRYEIDSFNEKLIEELEWLKSVQGLLLEEASRRKGKISGYWLKLLTQHYLPEVIEKLEAKRLQVQISQ